MCSFHISLSIKEYVFQTGEAFDAKYAKEVRICDFNYGSYENMTVKITGWDSSISVSPLLTKFYYKNYGIKNNYILMN